MLNLLRRYARTFFRGGIGDRNNHLCVEQLEDRHFLCAVPMDFVEPVCLPDAHTDVSAGLTPLASSDGADATLTLPIQESESEITPLPEAGLPSWAAERLNDESVTLIAAYSAFDGAIMVHYKTSAGSELWFSDDLVNEAVSINQFIETNTNVFGRFAIGQEVTAVKNIELDTVELSVSGMSGLQIRGTATVSLGFVSRNVNFEMTIPTLDTDVDSGNTLAHDDSHLRDFVASQVAAASFIGPLPAQPDSPLTNTHSSHTIMGPMPLVTPSPLTPIFGDRVFIEFFDEGPLERRDDEPRLIPQPLPRFDYRLPEYSRNQTELRDEIFSDDEFDAEKKLKRLDDQPLDDERLDDELLLDESDDQSQSPTTPSPLNDETNGDLNQKNTRRKSERAEETPHNTTQPETSHEQDSQRDIRRGDEPNPQPNQQDKLPHHELDEDPVSSGPSVVDQILAELEISTKDQLFVDSHATSSRVAGSSWQSIAKSNRSDQPNKVAPEKTPTLEKNSATVSASGAKSATMATR